MFFFEAAMWPFTAGVLAMLGLAFIEALGLLFASSPSATLDGFLPSVPEGADGALAWLYIGKVPALFLLILFLLGFSVSGYLLQWLSLVVTGAMMPVWNAVIPAAFGGGLTLNRLGPVLHRFLPMDESSAVSEQAFLGAFGVVVGATARQGMGAQIKVLDAYGRAHYLLAEPEDGTPALPEGSSVRLIRKVGAIYRCTEAAKLIEKRKGE